MNTITADIKTTGLDITKDVPIQLAYTVHTGKRETAFNKFYINPGKEFLPLKPKITEITGITEQNLLNEGLSPSQATTLWRGTVWNHRPCIVIGYNFINFDFPIIQNWLQNYSTERFKHPPIIEIKDVMHMTSVHFKTRKWLKLQDAATRLGIGFSVEDLHDALADVRLTYKVYQKLTEERR